MKNILIFLIFIFIVSLFYSYETPPLRVLFIGDSLTCYSGGWQHQVATNNGCQYTNLSVGGKRLEWMKFTLDNHLKKDNSYSHVFIYGGCNDAFSYVDLKKSVIWTQSMVDSCNKMGIIPVVILGYDPVKVTIKTIYDDDTTKRSRERYIELQKMMMNDLKNCKIIPVDTTVTYKDASDGIHLLASGHKKFSNWVITHLKY